MIIDLILDRAHGGRYNAHDFYFDVTGYGKIGEGIARALDGGTEEDVKRELCRYIHEQEYNPNICDFINAVKWLEDDKPPARRGWNFKATGMVATVTPRRGKPYTGEVFVDNRGYKWCEHGVFLDCIEFLGMLGIYTVEIEGGESNGIH